MAKINIRNTRRDSLRRRLQYIEMGWLQRLHRFSQRLRRIDGRLIVFEEFHGDRYGDSPRALYEAMLTDSRFDRFRFVWALQKPEQYAFLLENPRTTIVKHGSKEYYRAYARAKYWVVNALIPLTIAKSTGRQVMLQCWHGTPFKRLRHDIIDNTTATIDSPQDHVLRNNLDVRRFDYLVSQSRYASRHFMTAFNLEALGKKDIIIETGYPRNDFQVNHRPADAAAIRRRLKIPKGKKVILYAPTWRDDQYADGVGFVYTLPLDLAALQRDLGKEYVLLIRLHYMVASQLDLDAYGDFVRDVSQEDNVSELCVISDVLITDYSSIFFDYANLQRPMLFYLYDQEHYEHELRGLYLTSDKLPGDLVRTQAGLTDRLLDLAAYHDRTKQALADFHAAFNYLDDGGAAGRVIDIVWPRR